jgi:hypothetical protein
MPFRDKMRSSTVAIVGAVLVAGSLGAQGSPEERGGFYGLTYTPAGALPAVILVKDVRDSAGLGWAALRYGRYKFRDDPLVFVNYGVSGQLRVWRSVSLGGTYGYRSCNGCGGISMFSVDASGVLYHRDSQQRGEGDIEVGFQATGGYGKASAVDLSAMSVAGFMPLTVTLPQTYDALLTLTVLPGLAYGSLTDNTGQVFTSPTTAGSTRFILGAGVGYLFPAGLGLHATVHRVAVNESTTQAGLVVSWHR